ncbi:hypothetical protein HY58_02080 [Flavihumibacter sp. ZG627]|nr:hypothetical protein HY58_02080 [Flavihumibacter sp. ZG627]
MLFSDWNFCWVDVNDRLRNRSYLQKIIVDSKDMGKGKYGRKNVVVGRWRGYYIESNIYKSKVVGRRDVIYC